MGTEAVTVACVFRRSADYTPEYVYRLRDMVARHLHAPHRFVCLTNEKVDVETIPLITKWGRWWHKLELFRPQLFDGPVLYFDLDTVIVSDITDIALAKYDFACPTNWKGDSTAVMSSAVMAWDGTADNSHIFGTFDLSQRARYEKSWERWGDQGFIQDHLKRPFESLLVRWPGRLVHTKTNIWKGRHATDAQPPKGSSIVCFSGKPRPHQLPPENPLYKHWVGDHAGKH